MKRDPILIVIVFLCVIAGLIIVAFRSHDDATIDSTVTRVIDGDTIELADHTIIRYIGVNTPETVDPDRPVECFGHEASAYNARLIDHHHVHVILGEGESYGRKLGYVYVHGYMINRVLVRNGFAYTDPVPPNTEHAGDFAYLQQIAQGAHLGLWGTCYNHG